MENSTILTLPRVLPRVARRSSPHFLWLMATPLLFSVGLNVVDRFAIWPGEILLGTLVAGAVALLPAAVVLTLRPGRRS